MNQQPNVQQTFLRSLSVTISIASLILASAEDAFLPAGLTPLVALATYFLIDRYQVFSISIMVANVLGSLAFIAGAFEFFNNTVLGKLLAGAHLLIYISWVVLLLPKGIRQCWWILALSVLQVAVASVLTDESSFGLSIFGLMFVMIWTLSLFTIFRTQSRYAASSTSSDKVVTVQDSLNAPDDDHLDGQSGLVRIENGIQVDSDERWIGWRFRMVVCTAYVASVVVGVIAFFVFPRVWVPESPLAGLSQAMESTLSRTGFTENVTLGDIGDIMQSDARVMQFDITTMATGQSVTPDDFCRKIGMDELLFRGNVMGLYKDGHWDSGRPGGRVMSEAEGRRTLQKDPETAEFRLKISQDPPLQNFAFVPSPLRNIEESVQDLTLSKLQYSQSILVKTLSSIRSKPLSFEAWYSSKPKEQTVHSPTLPLTNEERRIYWPSFNQPRSTLQKRRYYANNWCMTPSIQDNLPQLTEISVQLCSDEGQLVSTRERLNRIFRYLNTSGTFGYSLSPRVDDYSIDPVEDFLLNRKSGHCEYFASACALMLQSVGVPARLVNGYKGFEENSLSGEFEVKQKHAHSWVEAWVDDQWETVDPTPAAARNAEVKEARSFSWWNDLRMVMNDGWLSMVQKMSPEQQQTMLKPLLDFAKDNWEKIKSQGLWATIKSFVTDFLLQPSKWFSLTTLLVTFFVLWIPVLIFRRNPFAWLKSRFPWLTSWASRGHGVHGSSVRFYEMFQQVCRKHGLELSDQHTAVENAEQAVRFFSFACEDDQDRDLPLRIATAFNAVRFGDAELPVEQRQQLRDEVNRFHRVLKEAAKQTALGNQPKVAT